MAYANTILHQVLSLIPRKKSLKLWPVNTVQNVAPGSFPVGTNSPAYFSFTWPDAKVRLNRMNLFSRPRMGVRGDHTIASLLALHEKHPSAAYSHSPPFTRPLLLSRQKASEELP